MKQLEKIIFIAGLVLLFGGLNIAILLSHMSHFIGLAFIIAGIGLLLWALRNEKSAIIKKSVKKDNIASKIVDFLTLQGRLKALIPVAGISVAVMVVAYNILRTGELNLGSNDYVTLVLAGVLLAYNYIPDKYRVERDFALLFSTLLFFLLVIPTTLLSLGGGEADTNTPLTYYLLVMPTSMLSRLLGIDVISPAVNPFTGLLAYNMIEVPGPEGVNFPLSIGLSCTGLYSVAIFVSAFIAFVAVEYKKFNRVVVTLLIIGIFLAWFANILRMTIIIIVGRFYGGATMLWTHNNIGELFFMAWVTLFWLFMFRRFGVLEEKERKPAKPIKEKRGLCQVCNKPLSPTRPSKKCECGVITHTECLEDTGGRCPVCGGTYGIIPVGED